MTVFVVQDKEMQRWSQHLDFVEWQRNEHHQWYTEPVQSCNERPDECDIQWIGTLYRIPLTAHKPLIHKQIELGIKHLFICMIWFIILRLEDERWDIIY